MKTPIAGSAGSWARLAAVSALALSLAAWPSNTAVAQEPTGSAASASSLSLDRALARAAEVDPGLPGLEARSRAGYAAVRQADVRPNPTLGLMVENLPTLGGGNIIDRTETTLSYEQRFERGGDRPARVALARGEAALVQAEAAIRRLDRLEQVQRAWADALGAQADLEIARERLALAERFQTDVQRRVDMARDPLFAGARAEAELAQAQIDFDQAETQARLARATLGRFWIGASDFPSIRPISKTPAPPAKSPARPTKSTSRFWPRNGISPKPEFASNRRGPRPTRPSASASVISGKVKTLVWWSAGRFRWDAMTGTKGPSNGRDSRAWRPKPTWRPSARSESARSPASRCS